MWNDDFLTHHFDFIKNTSQLINETNLHITVIIYAAFQKASMTDVPLVQFNRYKNVGLVIQLINIHYHYSIILFYIIVIVHIYTPTQNKW